MNALRKKLFLLAVSSIMCLIAPHAPFFGTIRLHDFNGKSLTDFFYMISALLLAYFLVEFQRYSFAMLIIENNIFCIRSAETEHKRQKGGMTVISSEATDIYISCFGILLGSKIIKFNTEGISLKKVEIGHDFISLHYGRGLRSEFIRILHRTIEEVELQEIIKQFRHETGIVPEVID